MADRSGDTADNALPKPPHAYPIALTDIERLGPTGLKAYGRLANLLELSHGERIALLGLPENAAWPDGATLTDEQFYRISYLIGIWKDTAGLFGVEAAIRRLKSPRQAEPVAGRSLIAYLIDEGISAFHEFRMEAAYWAHN